MSIQGKTIVFTGKISKPRHELQRLVGEHGGIAGSDVSKNTDYLVVGEKPGSKLFRANMLNIPTISEGQFLELLRDDQEEEIPLSPEELEELNSHRKTFTCYFCGREHEQFDTWVDTDTCFLCETRDVPKCPKCGYGNSQWVNDLKMYNCTSCNNWFKAPYSWNADRISHRHFWFRKTVKSNGDIKEECFCGAVIITHPNGKWEKHEPRHIIEQAKREAHEYAMEENRLCYERQQEEREQEKKIIKFIESLTPEQREELRRQCA